jgi:hypothetical protein
MKRANRFGVEIREIDSNVSENQMIHRGSVYLEIGVPSRPDEFRIKVSYGGASKENVDTIEYDFYELLEMPISCKTNVL